MYVCRICSLRFPTDLNGDFERHVLRCVQRHADFVDECRPVGAPFEGDPELAAFARAEGSVYDRRPGSRRQPR
jgi:hypothetical protein